MKMASGETWRKTFVSQFDELELFKGVATEFANLIVRLVGWIAMELILYQGNQLGSKRKKREEQRLGELIFDSSMRSPKRDRKPTCCCHETGLKPVCFSRP